MTDLIKREDAIKWFEPYADRGLKIPVETVIQNLNDIPSAENNGEWERIPYSMADYGRRCSLCHFKVGNPTNFCPNCGARMKGADDE